MAIPYYKQQTLFTCSLACVRMVLESIGIKATEYELAKIINFSPRRGVSPAMIKSVCEHLKVRYNFHFGATIEELMKTIDDRFYPIVLVKPTTLYNLPEMEHGHYIIVKNITDENVIVNDPDQEYGGKDKKVDLGNFMKAWESKFKLIFILKGKEK